MRRPQLASLEQTVYRSWIDDGVIDVVLGAATMILGFVFLTDIHFPGTDFDLPALLMVALPVLWRTLKRHVVEPRTGYVRLSAARRASLAAHQKSALGLWVALAVAIGVGVHLAKLDWLSDHKTLVIGWTCAIPVAWAAHVFALRRFYVHAAAIAVASAISAAIGTPHGSSWLAAGAFIIASGLSTLTRFLGALPPTADGPDATTALVDPLPAGPKDE